MVTGVEIAGLVLAAFPLIISAIEDYTSYVKPLKNGVHYWTELNKLTIAISLQQAFFENNLEVLLDPLVSSASVMKKLLSLPDGPEWHDPDLDDNLKRRLANNYEFYIGTIKTMKNILDNLKDGVGIVDGKARLLCHKTCLIVQIPDKDSRGGWKKRIKFVVKKMEWEKLADNLRDGNNNLNTLLGFSVTLASGRARRNTKLPSSWKNMRDRAVSLYDALASSWNCACAGSHFANLLLEDTFTRPEADNAQSLQLNEFKLWFSFKMDPDDKTRKLPWSWHHAKVTTIPNNPPRENRRSEQFKYTVTRKDASTHNIEDVKGNSIKIAKLTRQ